MSWTQKELDVCQEAFYLLRQDIDVPTVSMADSDTTPEWKKCKAAFARARAEVFTAHDWTWKTGDGTSLDHWPDGAVNALIYCLARELAIPIAGRMADMQAMDTLYRDKLLKAKLKDLDDLLKGNTDPVLAELLANFRSDDAGLANAYTIYTQRKSAVATEAEREINVAHGWRTAFDEDSTATGNGTSHPAHPAYTALIVSKLAQACGMDVNMASLMEQKYQLRLKEARVKDLSKGLDEICDNFVLPFVFAATGENSNPAQRTATMRMFTFGESMSAKIGYKLSALSIRVHETVSRGDSYQLVVFSVNKTSGARTLLAVSKNAAQPMAGSLLSWQFDDVALPSGCKILCQPIIGLHSFAEVAEEYDGLGPDEWWAITNTFPMQCSPAISTTEFVSDATDFEYWDGGSTAVTGITGAIRLYSYEQSATSLYTIAQRVMRRVFPFMTNGGDAPLPFSIEAFANSVNESCVAAENEVKTTLGTTSLDFVAEAAAEALATAHVAPALGLDANFAQLRLQEYAAKIQECRKLKLNASLASNSDPVLAQLLSNFKSDDAGLVNAYEIYTNRAAAVKSTAYEEIERIHDWQWIDSAWTAQTPLATKIAAMDGLTKAAHIALCAKYLAAACGMAPEMVNVYEQHYRARLKAARMADLESTSVTDPVDAEVLALVRGAFASEAALPRSMKSLTDKIDRLKEIARKEVLSSHDWSFAEAEVLCEGAWQDGDKAFPFAATLPKGCLVVSAVYGTDGKVAQWKVRGREVRAAQPITRIVYVKDLENYAAWHPKAYRAFILRLAADTAKSVAEKPSERQLQEQLYRDALEEAKACDARSANTPDEAYGDNELADRMLYGERSRHFDGLFAD